MTHSDSPSLLLRRMAQGQRGTPDDIDSIVGHLRLLLNAREGVAPSCPSYGLLDLIPLLKDLPHSGLTICARLRETIEAHEPRLTQVRVTQVKTAEPLGLQFAIEASLAQTGAHIAFKTQVIASQRLEVLP